MALINSSSQTMAKTEHDKPLPGLPALVSKPPSRSRRIIEATIRLLILAPSAFFLAFYFSAYIHSSQASVWGLVALLTLLISFPLRFMHLIIGHRTVNVVNRRLLRYYKDEKGPLVFGHFLFTCMWVYHICKADGIVIEGVNLARQSARLSGFGNNEQMAWNEGMKYTQGEAQALLAKKIAEWEVNSGFLGRGVYLTQLWARLPRVAEWWFFGLFWLSIYLVVMMFHDFGAMNTFVTQNETKAEEALKARLGMSDEDYSWAVFHQPLLLREALDKEILRREELIESLGA